MPRSVVDLAGLQKLEATIRSFNENTDASMSAYQHSAEDMLERFEAKLAELGRIREQKLAALNHCEYRRSFDASISCMAQESAYYSANSRYHRCQALVVEARNLILEYESFANSYRRTKNDLCLRAENGLRRVEGVVNEYNSNTLQATGDAMSAKIQGTSTMSSPIENVSNDKILGGGSFMFVRGGEQIDHIQPKSLGADPVRIDPNAMAESLGRLPGITAPDKSTMRIAASGILAAIAAGGLFVSTGMLVQQKADEIFEEQYGISRTELLLKSGPKQKEYVDAYNNIQEGLRQEMKEIRKEEIDGQLDSISKEIELFSKDDNLHSVREVNRLTIDEVNLKNERLSLEDGKIRASVPYDKTYIAGLSEKEMLYMMDHGGMSPGRFATVLKKLKESDEYKFVIQDDETYWFKDDKTQLKVTHDGSKISEIKAFAGKECFADAEMGLGDASQFDGYSWNSKKPSEVGREHAANTEIGSSISASGSCGAALNYREDWFTISEDGSILSAGYDVKLGPEAYAEGSGNVQGVTASAGVEAAKAEVSGTMSTRPMKVGRTIVQGGAEVTIGGTMGASGNVDFSVKQGVKAKAGLSALFKVGAQGQLSLLSLDELPPEVAKRLSESLPSTKQVAEETLIRMAEVDLASSRIKP